MIPSWICRNCSRLPAGVGVHQIVTGTTKSTHTNPRWPIFTEQRPELAEQRGPVSFAEFIIPSIHPNNGRSVVYFTRCVVDAMELGGWHEAGVSVGGAV